MRKSYDLNLPHQSRIRQWYGSVEAEPGFTEPALRALQSKVEDAETQGRPIICCLLLDEMAIKKHVFWDGTRFREYVDIGNGMEDDEDGDEDGDEEESNIAGDVLVFMAVSVNSSWKILIAYFYVDGKSGIERANLVKVAIKKLRDIKIKVIAMTCDGPSF